MRDPLKEAYNISDLREIARSRLPRGLFEFVDRGSEDEVALRNNRSSFDDIKLNPRALVDVSRRSQQVTLFGKQQKSPIIIAPTGAVGLMWHDGEVQLARAAAAAGIPCALSTAAMTAMERVMDEAGGTQWFQLYLWTDRSLSHKLVERARVAGYEALIVTVDGAVAGNREYNLRNGFTIPFSLSRRNVIDVATHPKWLLSVLGQYMLTTGMPRFENYPSGFMSRVTAAPLGHTAMRSDSLSWDDLRELRKLWPHQLIVKGLLHPQDARMAADCGADGVIVSNHGGRNLDSAPAPMDVLPQIADAVGHRLTVLINSGFRRGSDVVKALALGAQAVLIGRPALYGIAAAGERGAARTIGIFREEIDRVMALIGCSKIDELTRECLIVPSSDRSATRPAPKERLRAHEDPKVAA